MKTIIRTINTGNIGSKEYFENLGIILSVFINKGFVALKNDADKENASEKLVIYGYPKIGKSNKKVVQELYQL